jgi:hypothetical protein
MTQLQLQILLTIFRKIIIAFSLIFTLFSLGYIEAEAQSCPVWKYQMWPACAAPGDTFSSAPRPTVGAACAPEGAYHKYNGGSEGGSCFSPWGPYIIYEQYSCVSPPVCTLGTFDLKANGSDGPISVTAGSVVNLVGTFPTDSPTWSKFSCSIREALPSTNILASSATGNVTNNPTVNTTKTYQLECYEELEWPPFMIVGPTIEDSVTVNIAAPNNNPTAPTVTPNPFSGNVSIAYPFSFSATDPDGDTIRYQIDWDNNASADQSVPSASYVNSGTSQSASNASTRWPTAGSYTFRVRTEDSRGGVSAWTSVPVTITVPVTPRPTVTTQVATAVSSTTATINGTGNPNGFAATGWFRYSTTNPGATCNDTFGTRAPSSGGNNLNSGTSGVNFSQTITGLTRGTTYYFCALASNANGTATGTVRTFQTIPSTPAGLVGAASTCGTGVINLSWNSVTGATSYDIERDGVFVNVAGTSYSHSGLVAGSAHNYRVRAINATGASNWSSVVNVNAPAACAANTLPTANITAPATNPTITQGSIITFTGSGTDPDPGSSITTYDWRVGNCTTGTILYSGASNTFNNNTLAVGTHIVYLSVRDNAGGWSTNCPSRTVTVNAAVASCEVCAMRQNFVSGTQRCWIFNQGMTSFLQIDDNSTEASCMNGFDSKLWGYGTDYYGPWTGYGYVYKANYDEEGRPLGTQSVVPGSGLTQIGSVVDEGVFTGATYQNSPCFAGRTVPTGFPTSQIGGNLDVFSAPVQCAAPPNLSPIVYAGIDQAITLSTPSVQPSGATATDPDGSVSSRSWTFFSGPGPTPTITNGTTLTPTFSGMSTVGTYIFRLTATDNLGATGQDTMSVFVSNASADLTASNNSPFDPLGPYGGPAIENNQVVNFTGTAINSNAGSITQGGWADLQIDYNQDSGSGNGDVNYNAYGGVRLGSFTPGQTKSLSYSAAAGSIPVGTHRYRFHVDTDGSGVVELNETNNFSPWQVFTIKTPAGPEDIKANGSDGPITVASGSTVNLRGTFTAGGGDTCSIRNLTDLAVGAATGEVLYSTTAVSTITYQLYCITWIDYGGGIIGPFNPRVSDTVTVNVGPAITPQLILCPTTVPALLSGESYNSLTLRYWASLASTPDCNSTGFTNVTTNAGSNWSSSAGGVATVNNTNTSNKGDVLAVAPGTATIAAAYNGLTATKNVTVAASLPKIRICGGVTSLIMGLTTNWRLYYWATATAIPTCTTTTGRSDVTNSASWSSVDTATATVSSVGLVTGVGPGTVRIDSSYSGLNANRNITVDPPPPPEVNFITSGNGYLIRSGETTEVEFTVEATYPTRCQIYGPIDESSGAKIFTHNGSVADPSENYSRTTNQLSSSQRIIVECEPNPAIVGVVGTSAEIRIDVIPTIEEI